MEEDLDETGGGEPSCCIWCKCNRCKVLCLRFCCCCCKGLANDSRSRYHHHIPHEQLAHRSPIQLQYKYPQKYREYAIPPQLGGQEAEKLLVRKQPGHTAGKHVKLALPSDADPEDRGKRQGLRFIERSPEATLEQLSFHSAAKKKMSISVLRPLDASLLQKLEALKPESPTLPELHFSVYFDEQKPMHLIVHVNRAAHIQTQVPVISSKAFFQIYLLPSKLQVEQSHSVDKTHSLVFDRMFQLSHLGGLEELRRQMLVIRLYINVDHFVGGVVCSLEDDDLMGNEIVREITVFDEKEGLKESCQGDILTKICYYSRRNIIEVTILEVSNLKKLDILGLPNPYVKINFIHHGQRMSKWKTRTKKSTTNPIFMNEACEIDVSNISIEEIQFDVVVMNYNRLGHNSEVGIVSFGESVSHNSGQSHWRKIMIETNTEVSRWHPLIPPATWQRSSSHLKLSHSPIHRPKPAHGMAQPLH